MNSKPWGACLCAIWMLGGGALLGPACVAGDVGEDSENVAEAQDALVCQGDAQGICDDNNACTTDTCGRNGLCYNTAKPNGTACAGGTCVSGSCCQGCVQDGVCIGGRFPEACGLGGVACVDCPQEQNCGNGVCACYGCYDTNGYCHSGGNPNSCGMGGAMCAVCPTTWSCNGACVPP